MRTILLSAALAVAVTAACDRRGDDAPAAAPADTAATTASGEWAAPGAGPVNVLRERRHDLTGDGRDERILVTAAGERYDSLDVTLRIEDARGTPLWVERWSSRFYFEYDPLEGKSDEEVARIVRERVDALLEDARFHERGMPDGLIGGDPGEMQRESVRYHLAELDWRRGASLEAEDPTPAEAYRRIRPEIVSNERVEVILAEVSRRPSYNYFAGGEATYVIAWSEREQSFIRLFACC